MANTNAPFGFKWLGDVSVGKMTGVINEYLIPSSDATNYGIGDPVKSTGTGGLDPIAKINIPSVIIAAAGDALRGVIVGFRINPDNLNSIYGVASTTRIALVVDSPYATFLAQTNGTAAVTDFGANMDLAAGTPSLITGQSTFVLDEATVTASSAQFRILRPYPVENNAFGLYTQYIVMINEHELKSTSGV
jgi:hypothetical protein